jgi:hypothetical protein
LPISSRQLSIALAKQQIRRGENLLMTGNW